jgi:type IV secretion/conjugal transfer VirB4 family ATPase
MIKLSRILKDYDDSGAMNVLVNIHAAIDDHTFLTKSGGLMMMLGVQGADYESLDASQLDQIVRRFQSTLPILDENFRFYQYLVKRDAPPIPHRAYDNPVVQQAVANRMRYLQGKTLYSLDTTMVVVYEAPRRARGLRDGIMTLLKNPVSSLRQRLLDKNTITLFEDDLDRARETLSNKVMSLVIQLQDPFRVEVLDKRSAFHFLRRLVNYAPYKADGVRLKYDQFVDFQACDSLLECHRDHLRLDDFYVQVLTLKEPPTQTFAHLLRGLQELPSNYIIASEWKRESNANMRRLIASMRRHHHNSKSSLMNYATTSAQTAPKDMLVDNASVALVEDLGTCLEEMELKGHAFGQFSMSIALYDADRARVRRSVAECFKIFATHDGQLTEERYNLLNAWLAVLPGNDAYNLRRLWLEDTNYADLSFLFTLHAGETRNAHLGEEYLAVLESNHQTPYFLNLHYQDVAHSIVLGATGSGKSFFLNFLLTNLQKYQLLTYIFDLGGGYKYLTQLFNGTYVSVGIEKHSFTANPFILPATKENLHFLFSFVKVLTESGAYQMTAADERDLFEQIENIYVLEPEQRRLFTLTNMLNRNLRSALQKWVQGGQYGTLFDNVEDNLAFARFQTFDFEGMDKVPQVLEPLLFYVLHRANAAIYSNELTTTLKVFVIDEAWRFFRHPTIKLYILEALKTWRKKNAAMIMATQSSDDLMRSEMLSVAVESCATKMFLANPDMDRKVYREIFHLNETEAGLIAGLVPKRQLLVKRPDMSKVVNLNVDSKSYWLYTSNPHDRERRREAFERYGFEEGLEILARSNT